MNISSLSESHRLDQIPAFPPVLLALLNACQQAEPSSRDVERLAGQDPMVAIRLLAIASSPVYSRGRQATTVQEAVQLLGLKTVNTIAVTTGIHEFFSRIGGQHSPWMNDFWRRSLGAAFAARAIASHLPRVNNEEAFLAALLHDVGLPLLFVMYPEAMEQIRQDAAEQGRSMLDLEMEMLGISHDQLGASMVERWSLPAFLADALRYCTAPLDQLENAHPLVRVVHVASLLAQSPATPDPQALHASARLLNLGRAETARLLSEISTERDSLLESLGELDQAEVAAAPEGVHNLFMDNARNAALLGSIRPHLRYQGDGTELESVAQGLIMLFGLVHCACLRITPSGESMLGSIPLQAEDNLTDLEIPLDRRVSLFARCLLDNTPIDTLDPQISSSLSVLDRQIIARIPGDGVLCLPMYHEGSAVGVLALGIRHTQISAMVDQSELMLAFAGEAAALLHQVAQSEREQRSAQAGTQALEDSRLRRLSTELSTPVTVIQNYLGVLRHQIGEGPGRENLQLVADEIERVGDLLRRIGEANPEPSSEQMHTDVNQMVQEVLVLARESDLIPDSRPIQVQLDPRLDGVAAPVPILRKLILGLLGTLGGNARSFDSMAIQTLPEIQLDETAYQEFMLTISGDLRYADKAMKRKLEDARQAIEQFAGGRISWSMNAGKGIRVQVLWPVESAP